MKSETSLLDKEKTLARPIPALFVGVTLSGFITYLVSSHTTWVQWTYLLHTFTGLALSIVLSIYTYLHFKRTLGIRRAPLVLSGILTFANSFIVLITGLYITLFGQTESLKWIFWLHVQGSIVLLILIVSHLILHWSQPADRSKNKRRAFHTFDSELAKSLYKFVFYAFCIVVLLSVLSDLGTSDYSTDPAVSPYELPYGDHPFRPSQTETSTGGFVDARQISGSNKCGVCHEEITKQWRSSIHSLAASDPTYVTNIDLLAKKRGLAATRYCEGCHSPVALLSGQLTSGGDHGGTPGTVAFEEGVGCMGCHGISNVVHVKGVASYEFTPVKDYLFASSTNTFLQKMHNLLIRIQPRQHIEDLARPIIKSPQSCAVCHAQYMDKDMNEWGWVKMQDEYKAWLSSPYSGHSEQSFSHQEATRCHDCHLPLEKGIDPSANKDGLIVNHRTLGANTAIPYLSGDKEQLSLTRNFLQSGKIKVDIERPQRRAPTLSKQFTQQAIELGKETPSYFYLGEEVNIKTIVSNSQVGHDFPGGTTDINQVWLDFKVVDSQNKVVYQSGAIDNDKQVDKNAQFYGSTPIDKSGNTVWKHDLFNMIGESFRKTISSGGSDIVEYSFAIPYWAKSPLTISVVVRYRKFNQKYAMWALGKKGYDLPVTDLARKSITVALRERPPVESKQ